MPVMNNRGELFDERRKKNLSFDGEDKRKVDINDTKRHSKSSNTAASSAKSKGKSTSKKSSK